MADSILRLKVESQEYDNKLKRAAEGLQRYIKGCRDAGGTLEHLDDGVEEFVKTLGNMNTVATSSRGKLSEMTKAFTDMSMEYKNLTDQEKTSTFGKTLNASLDQLQGRIKQTKADLADINSKLDDTKIGGGGLFSSDKLSGMLQVFGGNVMTKVAGVGLGFVGELQDAVKQGIELAKQGEGIRIAFERLGRGDILQGLREATHGTVTDLELMKAAVKFNDFKLPLDELGVMLAYAQQKAKDTGQSVDYMVESITNGLGRQSKPILDNLGISAKEIEERMKSTGDFTKAVGEIIRDQMAKAGDYVETAADRATKANVSLQNKMEELGRKFAPVEEASTQLWTSIKIGILDIIGGPLARLLNGLTEAGRLKNMLDDINGGGNGRETQTEKALRLLRQYSGGGRGIEGKRDLYNRQVASFSSQEEKAWREANRLREELNGLRKQQKENGLAGNLQPLISETSRQLEAAENRAKALQIVRANYEAGAKGILNPTTGNPPSVVVTNTTGGSVGSTFDASKIVFTGGEGFKADPNANFLSVWSMMGGDQGLRQMMGIGKQQTDFGRVFDEYTEDPDKDKRNKKDKDVTAELTKAINGLTSIKGGLEGIGIKLPEELEKGLGVVQGLISIIEGVSAVISIFSSTAETANTVAVTANTVALGALTAAVSANTASNFIPFFAHGGVVPHAANGYYIPGSRYSGDTTPILANAGELVLNKSSQSNLAAEIQSAESLLRVLDVYQASVIGRAQYGNDAVAGAGGLSQNLHIEGILSGEIIRLVLNNNSRRTGRGEYVTTNFR